jgi:hypothetical protein
MFPPNISTLIRRFKFVIETIDFPSLHILLDIPDSVF